MRVLRGVEIEYEEHGSFYHGLHPIYREAVSDTVAFIVIAD